MRVATKTGWAGVAAVLGATIVLGAVSVPTAGPAWAGVTCNAAPSPGIDYSHCNLAGVDFAGADLAGADFQGATVTAADFENATLTGTTFTGANFTGTDFTGADLEGSYAQRATFTNAVFTNANLDDLTATSADFSGATFSGATFSGTILQAANLSGAQLVGADLAGVSGQTTGTPASLPVGWTFFNGYLIGAGANLRGAALAGDNMPGINLTGAIVSEVKFTGDDLTGAIFTGATVDDTGFENANLTDAVFSGDNLDGSNLTDADLSGTEFGDANLQNVTFTGTTGDATTDVTGVTWFDTTCPDGTNSNDDNDTCLGHGFYSPLLLAKSTTSTGYSAAGQTIGYDYLLTNTGNLAFTGVSVTDDRNTVTCPSDTLAAGTSETCTGSYTVTPTDVSAGSVTNIAVATASDTEGVVTSTPSAVTVLAVSPAPSISLTKSTTSAGYGVAGQTIGYDYLVTNTGTVTLTGVGVSDNMNTVACPSGSLSAGASETCTGTYTVTQADVDGGSVTNTATASSTSPVAVSAPSTVTVLASSATTSIALTKSTSSAGYGAAGQTIGYDYLVTNTGTTTLTDVSVSDDMNAVTCPSGSLAPATSQTCSGTYTVTQADVDGGSVTNTATAAGTHDGVVTSAPSSVTVDASLATTSISVVTSTTSAGYGAAGQTIDYTYLVTNTGTTTLTGVSVTATLSPASCPTGTLAPGASETCTGTYTVTRADVSAGSVTDTATAAGTHNGVVTSAPSSVTVDAVDCAPPAITSAASATAVVGTPFNFTVTTCTTAIPHIKEHHLPRGLTMVDNHNGTATILGIPEVRDAPQSTATIIVSVLGQPRAVQSFVVTVDQAPVFTSEAKYLATTGTAFSFPVTTAYGYPTPAIATTSALPAGVSLTDNHDGTASLAGTPGPGSGGVYVLTLSATNGVGTPVTQTFTLTVYQAPAITSVAADTITAGTAMTPFTVTATGYPVPVLKAKMVPQSLTFTNNFDGTATLAGTAKAAGSSTVVITATSHAGTSTQSFNLTVAP